MGMTITLDKAEYYPGDAVEATIRLELDDAVKARGVFARLTCMERKKVKYTRHIPQAEIEEKRRLGLYTEVPYTTEERVEERTTYDEEKKIGNEGGYKEGEFKVKFVIPANARPTSREFGHDSRIDVWNLHAKLDIPFAKDVNADQEVFVAGL